uniref:TNFR-Cys domain-containing protein n=1 Tax=Nannospalax galili TaxID=1026970 RepID=A0A8C6QXU7_NANGA
MSATPESLSSCRLDEYRSARHCCKLCPAGEHVGESCVSPHTQGECAKCEPGTFTKSANGLDSCLLCSTCGDGVPRRPPSSRNAALQRTQCVVQLLQ